MKKIIISGASGLVGHQLIPFLQQKGYQVVRLVRHQPKDDSEIFWDPLGNEIDLIKLEGAWGMIHLSGENIAAGRWNEKLKKKIRDSRILSTRLIVEAIRHVKIKPTVLLNASAIGFYGDRGDEILDEKSKSGTGFLADVCQDWESEALQAQKLGVRSALMRFGVLLSPKGGALKKLLPLFKWGFGAPLGSGQQYMSWMHIQDVVAAITHVLENPALAGPINFVSPQAVTNREFSKILARLLGRPCWPSVPAFAIKALGGEMAEDILLASTRAHPSVLLESGFQFAHPDLAQTLSHLIKEAP